MAGYSIVKGQRLTGAELEDLFAGLQANELTRGYTHVLTGYIGNRSFLESVMTFVKKLKQENGAIYVCDPVLGDNGKLYVPQDLVQVFREQVICLADIIKFNQFEAELLTGRTIQTEADATAVVDWFHTEKNIPVVVLTSAELSGDAGYLTLFASNSRSGQRFKVRFPKIEGGAFTGTGDLVAALLLAQLHVHRDDLKNAVEKALAGIQSVLQLTPTGHELRIIAARNLLLDPPIRFHAQPY